MTIIETPFQSFNGLDGRPLTNGKIYIGQVGTDPTVPANQLPVFWDEDLTIPAAQPLRTNAGYIVRVGTPTRAYVDSNYAMSVINASDVLIYYIADFGVPANLPPAPISINTIADLRSFASEGRVLSASVSGYWSPGDGGGTNGSVFTSDPSDATSLDDGATVILADDGMRWKLQDKRSMSVLQWGCRWNGASDDTPRAQAAIDYFTTNGGQLRLPAKGTGWITSLTIRRSLYTVNLHNDGSYLEAISTAPGQLGILNIVGCVNLFLTGAWRFNGGNRNNYQAALAIRVDPETSQPTTRIKIYNVTVRNAPIGIANGQYNNDLQCSEIGIFGADFFQCPQPIYNGGSNSGMQLVGCDITSESNANFPGVVETAIYQEGGFLKVTGGSIVSNPLASYTITEAPCQSTQYSANLYGTLDVVGAHVETNAPLLNVQNPRAFATTDSSLSSFKFVGNTGFAGGDVSRDFIYVNDAQYKGLIEVLACNWYSVNPRGGFNMSGLSSGARFSADKNSFGLNFQNWLGGIGFGRAIHDMAPVTSVSGLGLTYLAGQPVILKFQVKNVANELAKYGNQYNPVTGTFEVPIGGFSSLQITCNVAGQGTATSVDLYLRRGGATVIYGTVSSRVGTLSATLHDLLAGEILDIVLTPSGGTFIADNGLYNSLQIVGETR